MRQQKTSAITMQIACLCLSILSAISPLNSRASAMASFDSTDSAADVKLAALTILQRRCNTCHVRQNPGKVFTPENMNAFAARINEQVFIKRRMPRGKRLTEAEYTTLQNWLRTQNIK